MKFALIAILALAFVHCSIAQSHHYDWGIREEGDKLIFQENVNKKFSILQIVTKEVEYKVPARITFIKANDHYINGNGGYVQMVKGGPGYTGVGINFKSQRGHGFNFTVDIYGI